ncbi:MAG: helix-turn-helix transcriptional regulator [Bacteroidales bacterium]|nr:helix-turn-helix transcriptional regulator [Bacteroidales bacterium]
MNNRLQQFLDLENLSPARLADMLGVQRSGVSHILSGRNKPGFDFIQKLLIKFPSLNAEWFLTGRGKPYKEMGNPTISPTRDQAQFYSQNREANMRGNLQNGGNFQQQENKINGNRFNLSNNTNYNKEVSTSYNNISDNNSCNRENNLTDNKFNVNNNLSDNYSSLDNNIQNEYFNVDNFSTEDSPAADNSEIIVNFDNFEAEPIKSTFLEQNAQTGQNSAYLSDNKIYSTKNRASYRNENQINDSNKAQYQNKRSVSRIMVFYSDGSFDEFFPQQREK